MILKDFTVPISSERRTAESVRSLWCFTASWTCSTLNEAVGGITGRHAQLQPRLVNGLALICMITLLHRVYVTDTSSAGLLRDGKLWLLFGCSDVCLKYAESKSS